jgi:hypothetical protein
MKRFTIKRFFKKIKVLLKIIPSGETDKCFLLGQTSFLRPGQVRGVTELTSMALGNSGSQQTECGKIHERQI